MSTPTATDFAALGIVLPAGPRAHVRTTCPVCSEPPQTSESLPGRHAGDWGYFIVTTATGRVKPGAQHHALRCLRPVHPRRPTSSTGAD